MKRCPLRTASIEENFDDAAPTTAARRVLEAPESVADWTPPQRARLSPETEKALEDPEDYDTMGC